MNISNKTNTLAISAMLLAVGAMLHYITPPILGMQPDMSLIMLFIIFIINKGDFKISLVSGVVSGIFAGITTKFPGGLVPNIIDKIITTMIVFLIIISIENLLKSKVQDEAKRNFIIMCIVFPVGTAISGAVFLTSALILVGLPAAMMVLVGAVVIPAIFINTIIGMVIYNLSMGAIKVTSRC